MQGWSGCHLGHQQDGRQEAEEIPTFSASTKVFRSVKLSEKVEANPCRVG